jgi:hypothetical protein
MAALRRLGRYLGGHGLRQSIKETFNSRPIIKATLE